MSENDEARPVEHGATSPPAPPVASPHRRRWVRGALVAALVMLVAVVGTAVAIYVRSERRAKVKARDVTFPRTKEAVERGRYLVSVGCAPCHGDDLGGGKELVLPIVRAWSANLTPDPTGLGDWKDGQIEEALRRGVRPDGRILRPPMPVYTKLADEDLAAIVAHLRSVPAVSRPSRLPEPTLLGRLVFAQMKHPPHSVAIGLSAPPAGPTVEQGAYLAEEVLRCADCHHPRVRNVPVADKLWSGGMRFDLPGHPPVLSSNITPDEIEGIGKWSKADLSRAVKEGVTPVGGKLHEPMPHYPLADADVDALFVFLRSVPPVRRHVLSAEALAGAAHYASRGCVSCHGYDGKGPRADLRKLGATGDLAKIEAWVKDPAAVKPGTEMPRLGIDDPKELEEIARYVVELARE